MITRELTVNAYRFINCAEVNYKESGEMSISYFVILCLYGNIELLKFVIITHFFVIDEDLAVCHF